MSTSATNIWPSFTTEAPFIRIEFMKANLNKKNVNYFSKCCLLGWRP